MSVMLAAGVGRSAPPKGLKIRLTRQGDALSVAKLDKDDASSEEDGSEELGGSNNGGTGERGMVMHAVPSPTMYIDLAKIRRDREEERAPNDTPSKKSKHAGKNSATADAAVVVGRLTQEGEPPGATKSKMEANPDRGFQETIAAGGGGNVEAAAAAAPSTELAKAAPTAPSKTPDSAPRPEPLTREIYRIPSYAGWFQWGKIHPLERRAMSEFFDKRSASKTPKIYKEYRDFIINKYRENPKRALTFHEVRRMLIGDVNSLGRVFDFLEHWGLINHQVSSEQAASEAASPSPTVVDSYPSGINVVTAAVVSSGKAPSFPLLDTSGNSLAALHASNMATHKNVFSSPSKMTEVDSSKKPEDDTHCYSCRGDCSKQRFRRKQQPAISICPDCFNNGKIPAGTSASDFVHVVDGDPKAAVKEWTSKETLLLLEAVSRFSDNWNQVAAHVPTRTKSECVKHFIQLPFGDDYYIEPEEVKPAFGAHDSVQEKVPGVVPVSGDEEATISGHFVPNGAISSVHPPGATHGTAAIAAAQELVSPFTDTSHPLFAQVALLSGMVGPQVAAAAAQAAVAAIAEEEPGVSQLPFMQSSKMSSKHEKRASQLIQNCTDSLPEANQEMQAEGEGPSQGGMDDLPSAVQARASVATALGVAAANAKLLADHEEHEIEHLVANIIDSQMKKLCAKLEHFEELEMLLEKERLELERARQQVYADRLRYAEGQTARTKSSLRNPAPS